MKETIETAPVPQPQQSSHSDGGPAIPLRDWFAGQALAGWLASFDAEFAHPVANETEKSVAECSYKMADAMLKAREVKP
jgi:hypothetical protein